MQSTEGMEPNNGSPTPDDKLSAHEEFIAQLDSSNNPPAENKKKKRKIWFYLAICVWLVFATGIISFVVVINQIKDGAFGELPTAEDIENPRNPLSTDVYTSDGQIIGKYFTENRTNVSYDDLSPHLVNALIATEDERFTKHAGIDFKALFRVAIRTVLGGDRSGGGGSTLSQQLAKNLFDLRDEHRNNNMAIKKFQEWVIAVQLESKYTKEEILTMYLNTVDYLYGAYGIHAASHTYFGKDPKDLDMVEAASLVGMLKGPALYNPKRNADTAKYRRKIVYIQMYRNGFITEAEKDSLKELDVSLHMSTQDHNKGMAPYFREQLRQYLHDWQERTGYDIYKDGLKVYTTLNYKVQAHAEKALKDHMKYLQKNFFEHWEGRDVPWVKNVPIEKQVRFSQRYNWLIKKTKKKHNRRPTKEDIEAEFGKKIAMRVFSYRGEIDTLISPLDSVAYYKHFLQSGMMAVEPSTGYILSWVGGIDHKHFKYDHVNVKAKRQVGSTFKPFVYAAGIESGYLPCATAPNIPVVFSDIITGYDSNNEPIYGTWDAKNSPPEYGGKMSLMQGMATSTNTITAWVLKQIGPQAAVDMARRLGVTSKLEPYPAICLGVYDVSVFEMVGAFNAFNNNGLWVEPLFVTRIEDQYGNTIESFVPKSREAIDPVTNYAIVKMMQKVVQRGTGVRLISSNYYNIRTPLAGKTGTTQNGADGWFIGYEPGITAGVWVGGEDRSVAFRDMKFGQGARLAMPVFGDFINAINADEDLNFGDVTEFPKPNATIPFGLDCEFYKHNEEDQDNLDAGEDPDLRL